MASLIPYSELAKHTTRDSLWVLIDGSVYDISSLFNSHPGGTGPLLKWAGKDATKAFTPVHPPGTLETLPANALLGKIDAATLPQTTSGPTPEEERIRKARASLPPPEAVLNLREIESLAETVLGASAWGYYRSAGDDERTFDENRASFGQWWFRPRMLRKISRTDTSCTVFGFDSTLPIFVAPAALARLGHPDGEMNLVRAAGKQGILQGISHNSSCSTSEVMSAKQPGQQLLFQLYINKDRSSTERLLPRLRSDGYSGLIFTVDAAIAGKRERDQRAKGEFTGPAHGTTGTGEGTGVANAISGFIDPDISWEDILWIRGLTDLPIYVKGLQCVEDAVTALDGYNVQGIILSNHGGRSLDFAPPPMTILHELHLERPDLIEKYEVYIDGGVTRGTDVLKALCLGARGVGLGRAFLYGNALWGERGCARVIEIMREEIVTGMRLMGVTSVKQLRPELVRFAGDMGREGVWAKL